MVTEYKICPHCFQETIVRQVFANKVPEERILETGCVHAVEHGDPQVPVSFELNDEAEELEIINSHYATWRAA